nr:hypothetical protein [Nisaea denitrificans]
MSAGFPLLAEQINDALVPAAVRRDAVGLIHDDQVCFRDRVFEHFPRPHAGGEQDIVIVESLPFIRDLQCFNATSSRQGRLKLVQQNQPVTENDDFLAIVEPVDDFPGKNRFPSPGRSFENKSFVAFAYGLEVVDNTLLPAAELHDLKLFFLL